MITVCTVIFQMKNNSVSPLLALRPQTCWLDHDLCFTGAKLYSATVPAIGAQEILCRELGLPLPGMWVKSHCQSLKTREDLRPL